MATLTVGPVAHRQQGTATKSLGLILTRTSTRAKIIAADAQPSQHQPNRQRPSRSQRRNHQDGQCGGRRGLPANTSDQPVATSIAPSDGGPAEGPADPHDYHQKTHEDDGVIAGTAQPEREGR